MIRLVGVHPELAARVLRVLAAMEALGFPMMITAGVRSAAQQKALWDQGRSKPGPIVTYLDGVKKKSNHQAKEDGLGYAVDAVFLVDGKPSWDLQLPWSAYGAAAKALGLVWGGDWKMRDYPHVEFKD